MKSTYTETYRVLLELLVKARKDCGLTQTELADKMGRPQSFVSKYENGERRIDVVELIEIAGYLDADPRDILNELISD